MSKKLLIAAASTVVAALVLSSCGAGKTDGEDGKETTTGSNIVVGTTDKVTALDPAGSYDNGSYNVQYQVFSFVLAFPQGNPVPTPDAAEKCEFTEDPLIYQCTMKDGLKFANGNPLDAEAVKFTYDRQLAIADPNGPSSLLTNLDKVELPDANTVDFHLKSPNDVTFPQVLASPVGPLVDPKVFSATAVTPDQEVVDGMGFGGPYTIKSFQLNQLIEFAPNPEYKGVQGKVANTGVTAKYYAEANNLRIDIADGAIDVASRSLTPTDVETLKKTEGVKVYDGPGGEERYLVFNLNTMPGGTSEQKFAVRQAIASLVNREELATQVYKDTYTPLYSWIPAGVPGANEALKDAYGDSPDPVAAAKYLSDAGVATPIELNLQYNPDHYGSSSDQEYNAIKQQLEKDALFKVNLQATEWVTYNKERVADGYPVHQLGWFPDFPDADNYLSPFFAPGNFLVNHFEDANITAMLDKERTETDTTAREAILKEIQTELATKHLSTLPLLQGAQLAVARDGVTGVEKTLDASFQFRFATLSKS